MVPPAALAVSRPDQNPSGDLAKPSRIAARQAARAVEALISTWVKTVRVSLVSTASSRRTAGLPAAGRFGVPEQHGGRAKKNGLQRGVRAATMVTATFGFLRIARAEKRWWRRRRVRRNGRMTALTAEPATSRPLARWLSPVASLQCQTVEQAMDPMRRSAAAFFLPLRSGTASRPRTMRPRCRHNRVQRRLQALVP